MVATVGTPYRNYTHYTLYSSCLPIYGIAIIRSLSVLFLDDSEGNANISVSSESSFTVLLVSVLVLVPADIIIEPLVLHIILILY